MRLIARLLMLILALAPAAAVPAAESRGYTVIDRPAETENPEVIEFFWYGCPHCYRLEPYLKDWLKTKPDNVSFRRVPAVLGDQWLPHAKAFYAAESLGVLEKTHPALFNRIHKEGAPTPNRRALSKFFATLGVDKKQFNTAYNSKDTEQKIKESVIYSTRIRLRGVPALIVNGKYLVTGRTAGSHEKMISVVNELLAKDDTSAEVSDDDTGR